MVFLRASRASQCASLSVPRELTTSKRKKRFLVSGIRVRVSLHDARGVFLSFSSTLFSLSCFLDRSQSVLNVCTSYTVILGLGRVWRCAVHASPASPGLGLGYEKPGFPPRRRRGRGCSGDHSALMQGPPGSSASSLDAPNLAVPNLTLAAQCSTVFAVDGRTRLGPYQNLAVPDFGWATQKGGQGRETTFSDTEKAGTHTHTHTGRLPQARSGFSFAVGDTNTG